MFTKTNKGVVYTGPGKVEVKDIGYPSFDKFKKLDGTTVECHHGVIVKTILTNICGSDCHMVRGRTGAKPGMSLGHEITGEVVEVGKQVKFLNPGDLVSVPFNIGCGCCENCNRGYTMACLNINPKNPGGAYGYVDMGEWPGGQCQFVMVPYADFNCLRIPDKEKGMAKLLDIAILSDILPTGFNGAVQAKVGVGSAVYIAGAGPVGLCCAASCLLLGAAYVFIGDYEIGRLELAKKLGVITIDLNTTKDITKIFEKHREMPFVDCSIDCVGFESCGMHGHSRRTQKEIAEVFNQLIKITKPTGHISLPGVYLNEDPGAADEFAKKGGIGLYWGDAWTKGITIEQGQCPVKQFNRQLLNCILGGRLALAEALGVTVIPIEKAPEAYEAFDQGVPRKFMLDPNNIWKDYKGQSDWTFKRA